MRRASVGRWRGEKGAEIVESALVLVVFFFLVLGIIEAGRLTYAYNYVGRAAAEGARWASVRGGASTNPATNTTVANYVKKWAVGLDLSKITVSMTWLPDSNPGSQVKVQVSYDWSAVLNALLPRKVSVTGTSTMVVLQ